MIRIALAVFAVTGLIATLGASGNDEPRAEPLKEPKLIVAAVNDVPDVLSAAASVNEVNAYLAEQERLAIEAYLEMMRPKIEVDWARWERLHNCEQPGNWYANGGNPADGARQIFQGGLGMSTGAWQMAVRAAAARGVTLPASALAASPEEQMTGAQAFYDAHGWGWACRV